MQDLGYETHNSVLNLGSLAIFLALYFLKMLLYLLMEATVRLTGRGQGLAKFLKQGLFFGDILALVIDAYFEFIISGYLQGLHPLFTASGEKVSIYIGAVGFILAFVILPSLLIWQLTLP